MRFFERQEAPDFLNTNWQVWGEAYARRRNLGPTQFSWYITGFGAVDSKIRPLLSAQTQGHCSYCDHWQPRLGDESIDHFHPKGDARFYHLAYQWENLYFCCWHCQKAKGERYDQATLRPDEAGYSFERYFIFKAATGEIEPNPAASETDRQRADATIRELGFNKKGLPWARRREWEYFQNSDANDLNDFAYRFLFE